MNIFVISTLLSFFLPQNGNMNFSKSIAFITLLVLIIAWVYFLLSGRPHKVISIIWMDSSGMIKIRWSGYFYTPDSVVTSAHVVPDDRIMYQGISGDNIFSLTLVSRDISRDVAILSSSKKIGKSSGELFQRGTLEKNSPIFALVYRSGAVTRLDGKIRELDASILAYDQNGKSLTLTGILMTDIEFFPWESGSPLFDTEGSLIDVVHVR